jgi:large subunit ribosomal protein L3
MGAKTVTVQNLEIVKVDVEHNVLMIKGNIPGSKKALIKVRSAVKAR